ncbi:PREDICTED: uncharacterized protein LOC107168787 [Diuraphis noxia]|uniref:uncharacterized protein LOC107168787 n=1 Tax=Diuraphis noxia TaxID=143948 RepID=UPI0007635EED|nr:PREDICTED: uncharacterized protein LOC107168787 [Diuraphis noxia]
MLPSLSAAGGCYAGRRPMTEDECQVFARAAEKIAEERSMERIASTFRTAAAAAAEDYARRGGVYGGEYGSAAAGCVAGDYTPPHAMPLLPDMPTRSRRLLENLGSSPITDSVLLDGEQKAMQKKVNFLNVL